MQKGLEINIFFQIQIVSIAQKSHFIVAKWHHMVT